MYFLAILALSLLVGELPLAAVAVAPVPWYLRSLALPALFAALLTLIRVEGRPFHLAGHALLRHAVGSRKPAWVGGLRKRDHLLPGDVWFPDRLLMLPDGSEGRIRRFRYRGPGVVRIAVEHEHVLKRGFCGGRRLVVHCSDDARRLVSRRVIVLQRSARMVLR